jgi:DNA-binding MarR family transcriptional regulator
MIDKFRAILRRFEREISCQNSQCCSSGVSLVQCHTLLDVENSGVTNVTDIAERQGLDKSTVSRTVDGLYKIGLLNREINPNSRRQSIINLTENGKKVCCEINEKNNDFFQQALDELTEEERECFLRSFSKITAKMRDVREST